MKKFSDKTERKILILLEPSDINSLIYKLLKNEGYDFENNEVELRYDFVKEGSPEYITGKIKCNVTITKDLTYFVADPNA